MKVTAVLLARLSAWLEIAELTPRNEISTPQLVERLRERYSFRVGPQTPEQFDISKEGLNFADGQLNEINVLRLSLYLRGIIVETRSSTDDSEAFLSDLLGWINGLTGAETVRVIRRLYVSHLIFETDKGVALLNHRLAELGRWAAEKISERMETKLPAFEVCGLQFGFDELTYRFPPGRISVERREESPFPDNKYFSSAPLQTDDHVEFLKRFEAIVRPG